MSLAYNAATGGSGYTVEDLIADAVAVRDTNTATGNATEEIGGAAERSLVIQNGCNQQVTITPQWSPDGTNWFTVGATFTVAATTYDAKGVKDIALLQILRGKLRALYAYGSSPTSGAITLRFQRRYNQ